MIGRKLENWEKGTIVSAVKKGSSYGKMAKRFGISKPRVRRICEKAGVKSKQYFGGNHTKPITRIVSKKPVSGYIYGVDVAQKKSLIRRIKERIFG